MGHVSTELLYAVGERKPNEKVFAVFYKVGTYFSGVWRGELGRGESVEVGDLTFLSVNLNGFKIDGINLKKLYLTTEAHIF